MVANCCCTPKWPRKGKAGSNVILIRAYVRNQAHQMAMAAQVELDTHLDQLADYNLPILTDAEVAELMAFRDAVRDVDNLPGFPYDIVWPAVPQTLRKLVVS